MTYGGNRDGRSRANFLSLGCVVVISRLKCVRVPRDGCLAGKLVLFGVVIGLRYGERS